ncbi:hypothetical protein M3Y97_00233700 [Aphelenchoides bicaudatus]|nr:hypothetical protein M3Y97_00233700 [Aphelenchoides bicaudatus]
MLQSPTLSGTNPGTFTDFMVHRHYMSNGESLAALLGQSIDEQALAVHQLGRNTAFQHNLLNQNQNICPTTSSFASPLTSVSSNVKTEPFDGYISNGPGQLAPQRNTLAAEPPYHLVQQTDYVEPLISSVYAPMHGSIQINPVALSSQPHFGHLDTSSQHQQLLPICSITEETFDECYSNASSLMFDELCRSLIFHQQQLPDTLVKAKSAESAFEFCMTAAEEHINHIILWAKKFDKFNRISMDDQSRLIRLSWATLHLIDYTFAIVTDKIPKKISLTNGISVDSSFLALLGCVELESKWKNLCNQLRQLQFNEYDYTAFMCLSIFNLDAFAHQKNNLPVSHTVTQTHYELYYSWSNHRKTHPSHMPLNDVLAEFSSLAARAQANVYRHQRNESMPKLLGEMLADDNYYYSTAAMTT